MREKILTQLKDLADPQYLAFHSNLCPGTENTILDGISHEGYYVKMAVAWAVSIALIKQTDTTINYLKICRLDDFTYNKSLQKAIESYRISEEMKEKLRKMKR